MGNKLHITKEIANRMAITMVSTLNEHEYKIFSETDRIEICEEISKILRDGKWNQTRKAV